MIEELKNKIANGNVDFVLKELRSFGDTKIQNEAVQLSAQYESFKERKRLSLVSQNELNTEENKIINSILQLVETLPEQSFSKEGIIRKKKQLPWKIIAPGLIGIILLIAIIKLYPFNDSFSISVLVKQVDKNINDKIEGKVMIENGEFEIEKPLNKNRKIIFNDLPGSFIGEDFQLSFMPSEASMLNSFDTIYKFKKNGIFVIHPVKKNSIDSPSDPKETESGKEKKSDEVKKGTNQSTNSVEPQKEEKIEESVAIVKQKFSITISYPNAGKFISVNNQEMIPGPLGIFNIQAPKGKNLFKIFDNKKDEIVKFEADIIKNNMNFSCFNKSCICSGNCN